MSPKFANSFAAYSPSREMRKGTAPREWDSRVATTLVCGGRADELMGRLRVICPTESIVRGVAFRSTEPMGSVLLLAASPGEEFKLLAWAEDLLRLPHPLVIALVAGESSEAIAIAALRAGLKGYWSSMPSQQELIDFVKSPRSRDVEFDRPASTVRAQTACADSGMISDGAQMRSIADQLKSIAATNATVLITGETGTGKEVAADTIHRFSARRDGPFIAINCAALPEALAESELFGHERGAFTGAFQSQAGRIEQACGGTVLFDEIGDMPLSIQAKLLRTLEQKSVHRLGGRKHIPVNVRFVAATNRPVEQLLQEGKFRQDLYYRLAVTKVHLPPLRERAEEIEPLAAHLLQKLNIEYGRSVDGFTPQALGQLLRYSWPGNVRELRNVIERCLIRVARGHIDVGDLPDELQAVHCKMQPVRDERAELVSALDHTGWNKSEAAKLLRWSRMTLYRKISKYHVA